MHVTLMEAQLRGHLHTGKNNTVHAKKVAACYAPFNLSMGSQNLYNFEEKKIWASPPSLQTDVYGRSAMPNYTLPFENRAPMLSVVTNHLATWAGHER